jgi:putative tryptophan/tyrosine transport system substrate-binding protein
MRRRKSLALLGSVAVAFPLVARADKTHRIGVLMNFPSEDPEGRRRIAAFLPTLQKFGWTEGSNIRIDVRWAGDDPDLTRRYAEELAALAPEVLLAQGSSTVAALQRVTTSVPIVFAYSVYRDRSWRRDRRWRGFLLDRSWG